MKRVLIVMFSTLCLTGCPVDDNPACEKVMVCEDQTESECHKKGCGEVCNYYTTEWCWEECKDEGR